MHRGQRRRDHDHLFQSHAINLTHPLLQNTERRSKKPP